MMLKRTGSSSGNVQYKPASTSAVFNLCGYKCPRVFVLIMCILILILTVLIMEISYDAYTTRDRETEQQTNKALKADYIQPSVSGDAFAKNGPTKHNVAHHKIPVLIFCHARPQYLSRTLQSVYEVLHADDDHQMHWNDLFAVFISQDGNDPKVERIIQEYSAAKQAYWLQFDYSSTPMQMMKGFEQENWRVYHKISAHYKWALNKLLIEFEYDRVLILEEDMQIAPDFFSYFHRLSPLLDEDASIYCISSWNDNGQKGLVRDTSALYRTDVFPGLGWMLTQSLWRELRRNFSLAFWDDWMREPAQTRNRSCIRPEVSRTYTFGAIGSSGGFFYAQHLQPMVLNEEGVDWSAEGVDYLKLEAYEAYLKRVVDNAKTIEADKLTKREIKHMDEDEGDLVTYYRDLKEFDAIARDLRVMTDHKFGLPRTSYRGIVIVTIHQHRVLLVPQHIDWTSRRVPSRGDV